MLKLVELVVGCRPKAHGIVFSVLFLGCMSLSYEPTLTFIVWFTCLLIVFYWFECFTNCQKDGSVTCTQSRRVALYIHELAEFTVAYRLRPCRPWASATKHPGKMQLGPQCCEYSYMQDISVPLKICLVSTAVVLSLYLCSCDVVYYTL